MKPLRVALVTGICATSLGARHAMIEPLETEGSVRGNVAVVTVQEEEAECQLGPVVVLLIDEQRGAQAPDGRVDRVFRLQADPGTTVQLSFGPATADVRWTPDQVAIAKSGQEQIALALAGSQVDSPASVIRGFGLSHARGRDFGFTMRWDLEDSEYESFRDAVVALIDESCPCNAGGEGAFGCGYSCGGQQCSVTCMQGYEPCCGCNINNQPCCICQKAELEG